MSSSTSQLPGRSHLENISRDVACGIFSTDITEVFNIIQVSKSMKSLAQHCIKELTSTTKTLFSLNTLTGFRNLKTVDDNILLILKHTTPLYTMPDLQHANFYISGYNDFDLKFISDMLSVYSALKKPQATPRTSERSGESEKANKLFHILIYVVGTDLAEQGILMLVFQENRFMTLGVPGVPWILIERLLTNNPELTYYSPENAITSAFLENIQHLINRVVGFPTFYTAHRDYLMLQNARDFLYQADFGLIDPNQDESEFNLPVSYFAKQIADQGYIAREAFIQLVRIYALKQGYAATINQRSPIQLAGLLKDTFGYLISGAAMFTIDNRSLNPNNIYNFIGKMLIEPEDPIDLLHLRLYTIPNGNIPPGNIWLAMNMIDQAFNNR